MKTILFEGYGEFYVVLENITDGNLELHEFSNEDDYNSFIEDFDTEQFILNDKYKRADEGKRYRLVGSHEDYSCS